MSSKSPAVASIYLLISSGIIDISASLGSSGGVAGSGKLGLIVVSPCSLTNVLVSGTSTKGLILPLNSSAPGLAIDGFTLPPKALTADSITAIGTSGNISLISTELNP